MCYHPSSSLFQEVGFCRENYPIYRTSFVGQNRQTLLVLEALVKKKKVPPLNVLLKDLQTADMDRYKQNTGLPLFMYFIGLLLS